MNLGRRNLDFDIVDFDFGTADFDRRMDFVGTDFVDIAEKAAVD